MRSDKLHFRVGYLWLILLVFASVGFAQKAVSDAKTEEHKLNSKLMTREMPYRVVLPRSYEASKDSKTENPRRFPVIYLLHGLTGHYNNWTDRAKLAEYAAEYEFIIVTPEGGNGWYTDSATVPNEKYESYIVEELIPEIERKFRASSVRQDRFIAGLSMGGYGSLKFGLKYPEKFALVGSFSGALRATEWTDKIVGEWLSKSIMSVFGAAESETRRVNDIYRLVRETPTDKIKDLPYFYVDCGTEDFLIESNLDFAKTLREKKIPHEFRVLPGKHDWAYWDAQVREFLRLADKRLK